MNKCTNCGTEFEGKFCPECGAKWQEEKICPRCGATLKSSVKFCNECGYAFAPADEPPLRPAPPERTQTAVQTAPAGFFTEERLHKIYTLLGSVPVLLFALFSLLLFAFFAAPVAVASLGGEELFGEDMGSASLGNVYQMCGYSELPSLQGSMTALIVFAVFALLLAGAAAAARIVPDMREKEIGFGNFHVALPRLLVYAEYAFYLIFFIVACVAFGAIGSADEGMGMFSAGACPILLIVFSILFALFSAGAEVGKHFLGKKFPAFAQEERDNAERRSIVYNAHVEKRKEERAVQAEQRRQELAVAIASLDEPVPPQPPEAVEKPSLKDLPKPTGVLKKVLDVTKKKQLTAFWFLAPIVMSNGISPLLMSIFDPDDYSAMLIPGILSTVLFTVLFIIVLVSLSHVHLKSWNPEQIRKNGGMVAVAVFSFLAVLYGIFGFIILAFIYPDGVPTVVPILLLAIVIYFLAIFISAVSAKAKNKKLALDFYGTKKPEKDAQPLLDFDELNADYLGYLARKQTYRDYRKALRRHPVDKAVYSYEKMRYSHGKSYEKKPPRALLWLWAHKVAACSFAVLLITAIVVACAVPASLSNIFRAGKVSQIELGFTQEQVEKILGEPSNETGVLWEYYSPEYLNKLKEIDKLEQEAEHIENFDDLEKLLEKAEKLENQLETMEYKYISVSFENNQVSGVRFDASRRNGATSTEKAVNSVKLSKDSVEIREITEADGDIEIAVTIGYKDGSYQLYVLPPSALSSVDIFQAGTYTLEWSDGWGTYSASFTVL